ncbi:tripartite motif-containing protein 3-like [Branchiostoma lanceolatum]|uniref:tripartite motif-containing protein 3-like n=1 Tax=Branchiostoma lanceolatum TaxID=7740 RepID=UPI003456C744
MSLKKAIQQHRPPVQDLITEGRNILETYCSFIRGLREKEKSLDDQKRETDNQIDEAYRQAFDHIRQQLTEEKGRLLSEVDGKHRKNKESIKRQRDAVLIDVAELSSACDAADQDIARGDAGFLTRESKLDEVVGKFRERTVPNPVQAHPAVFQPKPNVSVELDCTLGDVTVPGAAAASGVATMVMGHHHGNQSHPVAPIPGLTFGGEGLEPGQFSRPLGVTVSEEEEIFVADMKNSRIQVFTLQGTFVRQFPTVVPGKKESMCPHNVTMEMEGNLWVVGGTECAEFAVQYTKHGWVQRKFKLKYTEQIRGVAVDTRRNHILITQTTVDYGDDEDSDNEENPHQNGEVLVFRPDGTLVRTVGRQQGMKDPGNIAVDGEGNILVSDCENDCVYVYNKDGQFLFHFGSEGRGEGQLLGPMGICTDRVGNIIVADRGNSRLDMFDNRGNFLKHIPVDIKSPWAVTMAPQGQLVITNFDDHTVAIVQSI